jgi:hypothetical protein
MNRSYQDWSPKRLVIKRYASEFDRLITHRYGGSLIRTRLHWPTHKRHGVYVIPLVQLVRDQIDELCGRFDIGSTGRLIL